VVTDGPLPPKYKIEPMDLANMRRNARSLVVACFGCQHEVIVNVDKYPGELLVREFGPRMVCTKCGMVGAPAALAMEQSLPIVIGLLCSPRRTWMTSNSVL
jgi:hypothetical protein